MNEVNNYYYQKMGLVHFDDRPVYFELYVVCCQHEDQAKTAF